MLVETLGAHPDVTCYLALFSRNEYLGGDHTVTRTLHDQLPRWVAWEDRKSHYAAFMADVLRVSPHSTAIGLKHQPEWTQGSHKLADRRSRREKDLPHAT